MMMKDAGNNRRLFLKKTTALSMAVMAGQVQADEGQQSTLPQVSLGSYKITRLIVGSNPMLGYSHLTGLVSQMMSDYFTVDRMVEFMLTCEKSGINTIQSSYSDKMNEALLKYREQGGQMHWILLANQELSNHPGMQEILRRHKPIAVAHHGWVTDKLYRSGDLQPCVDFIKWMKDEGVLAGISTHNPVILRHIEKQNWDHDFTMASFHYVTRTRDEIREKLGTVPVLANETYLPEDPVEMSQAVRESGKPTLVYKILAAGRYCRNAKEVEGRFKFAFENIKATDAVIVGMFPQFSDQIADNVKFTRQYA
ncbi:MAG: hypothetical protein ACOX5R_03835 [bacterium]|jgi:hypothetical protein